MTTTIAINCGCGFRFVDHSTDERGPKATVSTIMAEAQQHCHETGHTMEILGTVQP